MTTNIKELAITYASAFKYCFSYYSTESWIRRFASARWDNTLTENEISEEELKNLKLKKEFVDTFTKSIMAYKKSLSPSPYAEKVMNSKK